ncbi:MAG: IMP dehydrogenase [Parcubacteria group bacterium]
MKSFEETFTYDDVLLVPLFSDIRPRQTDVSTQFSRRIRLKAPLVSAPMDTVTEAPLAIALALEGGMGIIHKNMFSEKQAEEVEKVKRFENGFIEDPVVVTPEQKIADVYATKEQKGFSNIPVVDAKRKLVGIITELDYSVPEDLQVPVKFKMRILKEIMTAKKGITLEQANKIIKRERIAVLPVIDSSGILISIVTRKDLEKNVFYPNASKNEQKQLRVGAAVSVGSEALERAHLLAEAGVDAIVIDVAHGHSRGVIETIRLLKKERSLKAIDIVAGNIATAEGCRALIAAGADAVKVGVGPGSICTTRVVAGIGVPQLSAVLDSARGRGKSAVPIIADGGIKYSGDIVKALAGGAQTIMIGSLFAGTDEAPGEIEYYEGQMYKSYRGMGSREAMPFGSKDRYGQADEKKSSELIPEGVSGRVRYKGPVAKHIRQLIGGIRAGFAYIGAANINDLQRKAQFIRISDSAKRESHPYNISITKEAPNYPL